MNATNYHLQFEEQIEAYLANGLSGSEKEEFEKHNSICDACRKSLDDARRFAERVLQAFMPFRAQAGLEDRVIQSFRASLAQTRNKTAWSKLQRWIAVPAAAILLIIIGSMIMMPGMSSMKRQSRPAVLEELAIMECKVENENASSSVPLSGQPGEVSLRRSASNKSAGEKADYDDFIRVENDGNKEDTFHVTYYDGVGGGAGEKPKRDWNKSIHDALGIQTPVLGSVAENKPMLPIGAPLDANRKVIKTGTLSFEVDSFEAAYQKVIVILIEEKGYVASSSTTKLPNGKVRGQIIIRIPPEGFDSVTLKLRSLGELKNQQVNSEDVTKQYIDLQSRLKNAKALEERLVKLMSERKGEIKELLEVEKEIANTREKVELLQGEIKYYDNLTSLATVTLDITEKDIAKPVEYVQTQSAELTVAVADVEAAYQKVQSIISSLKGQIGEGNLGNQDKKAKGTIRAYVDAENFPSFLIQLKALGEPKYFNAAQTQTSSSGAPVGENTPVRKERGLVALSLIPPAGEYVQTKRAQIVLEAADVDNIYTKAQGIVSESQAKILNGSINRSTDRIQATLSCQVEADKFRALVEGLKAIGKVKSANVDERQESSGIDPKSTLAAPVRKDPGTIVLTIINPGAIVSEEHGVGATLKDTLKGSIAGLLWSLEMLIVGLLSIAPWVIAMVIIWLIVKRFKQKKEA
jgi:hypothetical protein